MAMRMRLIPIEHGREMKAALPSANYAELKGAGHMSMMEKPKATAEALIYFCKRLTICFAAFPLIGLSLHFRITQQ